MSAAGAAGSTPSPSPGIWPIGSTRSPKAAASPQRSRYARVQLDRFLRQVGLMVPRPSEVAKEFERWEEWITNWSLPLEEITDHHLHCFLESVRFTALDGTRRDLAPSSLRRTRAVVRGAFTNARKRRRIEWDPWDAIEMEPLRDVDQVDPDLVMDPEQVRSMASACAAIDRRYEAFVLIQGFCGLRPGEAVEIRGRDFAL